MKYLKLLAIISFMTFCLQSYSQLEITSYSIYALGINTSQDRPISVELKAFANRDLIDLLMEIDGFYNFKSREYHRFSIGLGVNLNSFDGSDLIHAFTIPAAIEIYPLQDFKKISILFELTPEFVIEDDFRLRSLWGIRYTFGDQTNFKNDIFL